MRFTKGTFMTPLSTSIRRVSDTDGSILLDVRRGTMYRLNSLGSQILNLLERGDSLPYIAAQLSVQFGVPLDVVQTDIQEFLQSLKLHGVLDPRSPKNIDPNAR